MKNLLLFSLILTLFSFCASSNKITGTKHEIKEGSQLFYMVTAGQQAYNFDLTMKSYEKDFISFDWKLMERNGSINMTKNALENATAMKNNFSGGPTNLNDKTSVWISKKVFRELKKGNNVELDMGNGNTETYKMTKKESYSFGKEKNVILPVFVATSTTSNTNEIWILDDPANPIILMMNIEFKVALADWTL